MKPRILLLDDEENLLKWLGYALEEQGYEVFGTTEPNTALSRLRQQPFDLVISDIRMPDMDGFAFLRRVRTMYPNLPFIFITAYGSMDSVINALRDRVSDYIIKPFGIEEILLRIAENLKPKKRTPSDLIGDSPAIRKIMERVGKIAPTETTVLIQGESGTGKELIAHAIHRGSPRAANPFISISCAALPETLLESELFGYRKGAFTGAVSDKDGLFKAADRGTFFLDEIGDAPLVIQSKVLRLLEQQEITPLGATTPVRVDVRLIAATNKNLADEVKKGAFREDLYYRLNVIPLQLPPLRERREDIPLLADFFLKEFCRHEHLGERRLLNETVAVLQKYSWPGNVRELKHVIERAVVLTDAYFIRPEHLGLPGDVPRRRTLEETERAEIKRVMAECDGNVAKAAKRLGISRATLYRRLKQR